MIRGITILWVLLALCAGVGLFLLKHDVQTMEDRLAQLNRTIKTDRTEIHVLQAEWTYLNDPDRLRALTAKFLPDMKPVSSDQVTTLAALPVRPPQLPDVQTLSGNGDSGATNKTKKDTDRPTQRPTNDPTARDLPRPTVRPATRRSRRGKASGAGQDPRLTGRSASPLTARLLSSRHSARPV